MRRTATTMLTSCSIVSTAPGFPSAYNQSGLAEYGQGKADSYFTYAARSTDNGYAVEYSIPVSAKEVGINLQINDVLSDGSQSLAMAPSKVTGAGAGSWTAGEYPYVTIGGSTVSLPVEDSGEATGGSAATFDFTAVAAVGAALSCGWLRSHQEEKVIAFQIISFQAVRR